MAQRLLALKLVREVRVGFHSPQVSRGVHTSSVLAGKRNFRKFSLGNKRGTRLFKEQRDAGKYPDFPIRTEVKEIGYKYGDRFVIVPEMIPELVVPDLEGCQLKPYVSYRTPKIAEDPFTAQDLFEVVYKNKIIDDFKKGKILADGTALEESPEEKLAAEEAEQAARMTGCDIFSERIPKQWECLEVDLTVKKSKFN